MLDKAKRPYSHQQNKKKYNENNENLDNISKQKAIPK